MVEVAVSVEGLVEAHAANACTRSKPQSRARAPALGNLHPIEATVGVEELVEDTCARTRVAGTFPGGQFEIGAGSCEPLARRLPARRGHPGKRFLCRGGWGQFAPPCTPA